MLHKLHPYCQKVLPLVYDNSLSYYEVLCKIVDKINEMINVFGGNVDSAVEAKIDSMMESGELETIIANTATKYLNTVKYYYVDAVNGNDDNDGLTVETAFSTLGRALSLLNAGVSDLGIYFVSSGEYFIEDQYVISGGALHMRNYNNSDVTIRSRSDRFINYGAHLSWYGSNGHPMKVFVETVRSDGGEWWAEYCWFTGHVVLNGTNCRWRWCTFDKTLGVNHACVNLEDATLRNQESEIQALNIFAGVVFLSGSTLTVSKGDAPLPDLSRVVTIRGGLLAMSSPLQLITDITEPVYNFGIRGYGGTACARRVDVEQFATIATSAYEMSGVMLNQPIA